MELFELKELVSCNLQEALKVRTEVVSKKDRNLFCLYLFKLLEKKVLTKKIDETLFTQILGLTYYFEIQEPRVLFKKAFLLYRFFLNYNNVFYLKYAIKVVESLKKRPSTFSFKRLRSIANIYLIYYMHVGKAHALELSLNYFSQAFEKNISTVPSRFLWEWANAWYLLAKISHEPHDLYKALELLRSCHELFEKDLMVLKDLCKTLIALGKTTWNPAYFKEAIQLASDKINLLYFQKHPRDITKPFWYVLLEAKVNLWFFQQSESLHEIETLFTKAVMLFPKESIFWLEWSSFLIQVGFQLQDLTYLEKAIDKLTSLKATECDPYEVSLILSEGLFALGLLSEDNRLFQTAKACLNEVVALFPRKEQVIYTQAYADYIQGLFFQDSTFFKTSLKRTKALLSSNPFCLKFSILKALSYAHLVKKSAYKQDIEKALKQLESLMRFTSQASLVTQYGELALILFKKTKHLDSLEKATVFLKQYLKNHEDPQVTFYLLRVLFMYAEHTEFLEVYQEIFYYESKLRDPHIDHELFRLRAQIHLLFGLRTHNIYYLDESIALLKEGIYTDPLNDYFQADLGIAYLARFLLKKSKKDLTLSHKFLLQAKNLGNDIVVAPLAWIYQSLGLIKKGNALLESDFQYRKRFQLESFLLFEKVMEIFNKQSKTNKG